MFKSSPLKGMVYVAHRTNMRRLRWYRLPYDHRRGGVEDIEVSEVPEAIRRAAYRYLWRRKESNVVPAMRHDVTHHASNRGHGQALHAVELSRTGAFTA